MRESLRGKINKSNLSQQAFQAIKAHILSFDYEPGRRIVIESLSEELGISCTPVRDAIRELVNQGFIEYDGNTHKVRVYSRREIADLFAIRSALEALAIELVVQRADAKDLETFLSICEKSENAIKKKEYKNLTNLDIDFHVAISNAARNDQLGQILQNVRVRSWYIRRLVFELHAHENEEHFAVAEHLAIIAQVRSRSIEGAAGCMREHMRNAEERTLRHVANVNSSTLLT